MGYPKYPMYYTCCKVAASMYFFAVHVLLYVRLCGGSVGAEDRCGLCPCVAYNLVAAWMVEN